MTLRKERNRRIHPGTDPAEDGHVPGPYLTGLSAKCLDSVLWFEQPPVTMAAGLGAFIH